MIRLRIVPICASLLLLAACGGQTAPSPSASTAPPSAAGPAASASAAAKPAGSSAAAASAKPAASSAAAASGKPAASGAAAASAKPAASIAAGSAAAGALPKMTIPYNQVSVSQTPLFVAVEQGLFKKYGVDVSTEYMANSPQLVAAMLGGQINMSSAGQDAVVGADLNGGDIVVVATGVDKLIFSIYGTPKIEKLADLKGKKLGITSIGASTDFVGRYVLRQANLQPEKDVAILQMGGQPQMLAGLISGAIDAAVLVPPVTTQAKKQGFKELANLADYNLAFYQGPVDARKSWLQANRAQALNVMKGYIAGIAATYQDKPGTLEAISKYTKVTDAQELDDSYQAILRALPKNPLPKAEAIKTSLEQNTSPNAKTADPATMVDASLVEELQKSGFIDSLYK
jgi:NitT/TauT family transport system substrate-binding protein